MSRTVLISRGRAVSSQEKENKLSLELRISCPSNVSKTIQDLIPFPIIPSSRSVAFFYRQSSGDLTES